MGRPRTCFQRPSRSRRIALAALAAGAWCGSASAEAAAGDDVALAAGPAPRPAPEAAEPAPNYLRPALEIGAGLAAASIWYWVDDRNVLDWDYPSAEERLNGEAWRFDNNTFALNYFWHPLAGAGMYVLARGNRLGVAPSLGYSLVGSTLWEYVIEFKEKVSINDMLITPLAGLAVGEFFHKLALYVTSVPPRSVSRDVLAWTFGLSVHGHRKLDGLGPPPAAALDQLGYSPELWHQLSLQYGFGIAESDSQTARGVHAVSCEASFVSLPGYLRAPRLGRWFHGADLASLRLELDFGSPRAGLDVFGETLLAGYHYQSLVPTGKTGHGEAQRPPSESGRTPAAFAGGAITAALGVAYTYRTTEAFGFDDRAGLLYVPGLRLQATHVHRRFRAHFGMRVYPSFGSMSGPSYNRWRMEHAGARTKTAVEREGYFYGWGGSVMSEARLGASDIEVRGQIAYDHLASIEGLDRTQERVTRDAHLVEGSLRYGASAWIGMESAPLEFGLVFERSERKSRMENVQEDVAGQRLLLRTAMPL